MKPMGVKANKNGYQSDDDHVRYKINMDYFNNRSRSPTKVRKQEKQILNDDDDIRYKFPTVLNKPKANEQKHKPRPKIKVNFWSNKQSLSRLQNTDVSNRKTNRRHTVAATSQDAPLDIPKPVVKVRKRVSFLPSPLFSDKHNPMVTVPDDLTIHLNEEEANDLGEDLNLAFVNSNDKLNDSPKRKSSSSLPQSSPGNKRKKISKDSESHTRGNENELEFFSKYVVQKLRRMETNQRIYSENLINTVLMLGQLGKLNGKSKINEA